MEYVKGRGSTEGGFGWDEDDKEMGTAENLDLNDVAAGTGNPVASILNQYPSWVQLPRCCAHAAIGLRRRSSGVGGARAVHSIIFREQRAKRRKGVGDV